MKVIRGWVKLHLSLQFFERSKGHMLLAFVSVKVEARAL